MPQSYWCGEGEGEEEEGENVHLKTQSPQGAWVNISVRSNIKKIPPKSKNYHYIIFVLLLKSKTPKMCIETIQMFYKINPKSGNEGHLMLCKSIIT